jgi:hypothetical protein
VKPKFSRTTIFLVASFAAIVAAIAANDWWDDMQVEHKGTVIDATDGKPVEGAFVMAEYTESGGSWFGHGSSWCVRTRGMYTGPDGTFSFPGRRRSGPTVSAVKPGYFETLAWRYNERGLPPRDGSPSDRYLEPQDPQKPEFPASPSCERPRTRQDAAAIVVLLKIVLAERLRYGDPKKTASTLAEIINRLELLPETR